MESWTSHGNRRRNQECVCERVFSPVFLLWLHYCPVPRSLCHSSGRAPSAPLADISVTGTEREKLSVGSESVTALTKTCQWKCCVSVCTRMHAYAAQIVDWNPRRLS